MGEAARRPRRSFAAIHRDVWRVLLAAPGVTLVLPLVLWLGVEAALLSTSRALVDDAFTRMQLEGFLFIPASLLASLPTVALVYGTARVVGRGERGHAAALAEARAVFGAAARVTFGYLFRYFAGLLLLAIPGLVAAVRHAFVVPRVLLGGEDPSQALNKGKRGTRGHRWRILGFWLLTTLLYQGLPWGLQFAGGALEGTEPQAGLALTVLGYGLGDLVLVGTFLGAGLMWADTVDLDLDAPLTRADDAPSPLPALLAALAVGLGGWTLTVLMMT